MMPFGDQIICSRIMSIYGGVAERSRLWIRKRAAERGAIVARLFDSRRKCGAFARTPTLFDDQILARLVVLCVRSTGGRKKRTGLAAGPLASPGSVGEFTLACAFALS